MTNFHDVSFPLALGFGLRGGPVRRTDITKLASGAEHRNSPHQHSRRQYDVGGAVKSLDDVSALLAFFEARQGSRFAFRLRDPMDYQSNLPGSSLSSADQHIGTGDGVTSSFQLLKTYADAAGHYERPITKPVIGTVMAAIDGAAAAVTVSGSSGVISFSEPPALGAIITAGFQFDVPVRFDMDYLEISLESFRAGLLSKIPLIEVLDHA